MNSKICSDCKEDISLSQYYFRKSTNSPLSYCKKCSNIRTNKYRKKNPDKLKIIKKREREKNWERCRKEQKYWREMNSEYLKNNRPKYSRYKQMEWNYGISKEEFLALYIRQNKSCAICKKFFSKNKLHIDHNHKTNKVRGLLCMHCNFGIGHFKEDNSLLIGAIQYLNIYNDGA